VELDETRTKTLKRRSIDVMLCKGKGGIGWEGAKRMRVPEFIMALHAINTKPD
jgi:hypothetical protein